jgi:hypothetical protein
MTKTIQLSLALALALTAACSKKGGDDKAAAKGTDKPAVAPVWKKIASIGIEVEVAPDADVQDNTASSGFPSSTIYSSGTPTTFIFGAKNIDESIAIAKDLDATKARMQKEHSDGFKLTKEEKAADGVGFELRATSTDMFEKDKLLHSIVIRSKVGDMVLDCQTNASSEAEIDATAKLCKSIRAAK